MKYRCQGTFNDVDNSCNIRRGRKREPCRYTEVSRADEHEEMKCAEEMRLYPWPRALKIHQRGLEDVGCKKVGDSSFFALKRTWDRLNNDFPITEATKKRLLPLALEGDARRVYEEVADFAVGLPTSNVWKKLEERLFNKVH